MNAIRFLGGCFALIMLASAQAAAPANFSGTWVLNTDRGQNLGMVAAIQETLVIVQTDGTLDKFFTDVFQGKTSERDVSYDLSGAEVINFAAMGEQSRTQSSWDGDKLVTTWTSKGAIAGTSVVKTETMWLTGEGSSLSVETARDDRPSMILVYDRQE